MKKSIKMMFLFILGVFSVFLICPNVYAEDFGKKVTFKTYIDDWKDNNDLTFACGSAVATNGTITPTVRYGVEGGTLSTGSCNFSLSSLNMSVSTFIIVEEYDFTNYVGVSPEFEKIVVHPGLVSSATIAYDEDTYMFGNYEALEDVDAYVYNLNTVDANQNIVGGLFVDYAYLDIENVKEESYSLGYINIPSYCVRLTFNVKGNIANTYGTFTFNLPRGNTPLTATRNQIKSFCEIDGSPLTNSDIQAIMNADSSGTNPMITYTGVARAEDYECDVTDTGIEVESAGVYYQTGTVTALLESDGSQTGLIYTVIPFVLIMIVVGGGVIVISRNKVKEQ